MLRESSSLLIAVLCACSALANKMTDIESLMAQPSRCTYDYSFNMYGADCAGLQLSKIPNLRGSIEILYFSDNELQELNKDTLSSFTSIKILYLAKNRIYNIDDDALTALSDLEILDLSKNFIFNLPISVFQLPNLRTLYLSGNPLFHMTVDGAIDIRAPLELLDLSDCKIKILPEWGMLPQLRLYNISFNPLTKLEAKHFAVMCNLNTVDITKAIDDISLCALRPVVLWFQEKQINFDLDDYSKLNTREFEKCSVREDFVAYNGTYQMCKSQYSQVQRRRTTRRTWLTIGGGLAGFSIAFMVVLYIMHRINVARTKSTDIKKSKPVPKGDKQATAVLLSDVS